MTYSYGMQIKVVLSNPMKESIIEKFSILQCIMPSFTGFSFKDNSRFVSCGGDKVFYLWDVLTGKYIRKVIAH